MNKAVVALLSAAAGAIGSGIVVSNKETEKTKAAKKMSDKHLGLYLMMNQWVKVKQQGKNVADYLLAHNYKKIAIYGMSYVGETLVEELKDTDVQIAYAIDKNSENIYSNLEIISGDGELEHVDAVIVTPIFFFSEIEESLSGKLNCEIISLEDILYEV